MAKRKKRVSTTKKKKTDAPDEVQEEEDPEPSAKKVAASSTSFTEDDASQMPSFSSIGKSDVSGNSLGFSSHFWCNYCEFSADTKQELIVHMRQHMIKCSFCTFNSLSRAEVLRHVKCEHADEVEVDLSSTTSDYDMDKDPCCACIFCDFLTYSTEYLEKHTIAKHRGMLPKSVAKMISKSVSAKVRQADALFYSALSTEANDKDIDQDAPKSESPSSSNTIVIEEENKNLHDVKPFVKDLLITAAKEFSPSSQVSSCAKLDSGEEEKASNLASQRSQVLSKEESPCDWKVKVETMYCLSCPYSNVAIDKLKCHTFSQHPTGAAIAKNSSSEAIHGLLDVMFFCVKTSCTHSTNTTVAYEEHIMNCCPLHQSLPEDEMERLRATLKFLPDFHKTHNLKMATGFQDYVSYFNKIFALEGPSGPSLSNNSTLKEDKFHSENSDSKMKIVKLQDASEEDGSLPTIIPDLETQHSSLPVIANVSSQHPDSIQQHTSFDLSSENNHGAQALGLATHEGGEIHNPAMPNLSHPNESGSRGPSQRPHVGVQQTYFPPSQKPLQGHGNQIHLPLLTSQSPVGSAPENFDQSCNNAPFESSQRFHPGPQHNPNVRNAGQDHQSSFVEQDQFVTNFQNNTGTLPANFSTFNSPQPTSISIQSAAPPYSHNGLLNTNSHQGSGQLNVPVPLNSSHDLPAVLPTQQFQSTDGNQLSSTSLIPNVLDPPKMLDLLSDTYNILLEEDLDLTSTLGNQIGDTISQQSTEPPPQEFETQQSAMSNAQKTGNFNPEIPLSSGPPKYSMQQSTESIPSVSVSQQPLMSYHPVVHSQQSAASSAIPAQYPGPGLVSQKSPMPNSYSGSLPAPMEASPSNSIATNPTSENYISQVSSSVSSASTQQYAPHELMTESPQFPQSTSNLLSQAPVSGPVVISDPIDISSSSQASEIPSFPSHEQPVPSLNGHPPTYPNAPVHSKTQADNQVSQNNNLSSSINNQGAISSFLESSSSNTHSMQNWHGNQSTDIPNFLVTSSQHETNFVQNQSDPKFLPNQDAVARPSVPMTSVTPSTSHMTPVKNQPIQGPRNVAGNSPLSPSIYLNGQAPRHNRSSWTNADMMPRGPMMPLMRPRAPGPISHPAQSNIRQNLFPPQKFRGRGRPRGPRMQSRYINPSPRPLDDDVIVTAVVRGPSPSQAQGRPANRRGMARMPMAGQRRPMQHGRGRGMVRALLNTPAVPPQLKKSFDVSKHFVDLACVVNTANDDEENNGGGDEVQIMGVTPGLSAGKGQNKGVDIKKFSFSCVHCGKDQGSKQVMKQHMRTSHTDSLLGAFRNIETGQLLFFCPQLQCDFMTYDEQRLTDHLYSCYNLDKSRHLPFDLPSALKNLQSLKIRTVNANAGSQKHPIDLDGQGLRDAFNNNLTDAFDDMVENTIGRQMIRPNHNAQLATSSPSNPPLGRPPVYVHPRGGRPFSGNARMSRHPHYQPRQPQMRPGSPGQHGNPRMHPNQQPPPYRMAGRRNFRQPIPAGAMRPVRGGHISQVPRPPLRGHPPNPRPLNPVPVIGNENEPILIDIDSETPNTPPTSQSPYTSVNNQTIASTEATSTEATTVSSETGISATMECASVSSHQSMNYPSNVSQGPSIFSSSTGNDFAEIPKELSATNSEKRNSPDTPYSQHQHQDTSKEVDRTCHNFSNESMQQNQNKEINTPDIPTAVSQDNNICGNNVSELNRDNAILEEEFLLHGGGSNEELVNAILLKKVFAKVPHMPKKCSQRLVLRFKEFAAKRGVVITPNSKVIDEFVERISYKGSNPLTKQQQQQQQEHPHQQEQQQQQQERQQQQECQQQQQERQQQQECQQQQQERQQQQECQQHQQMSYEPQQSQFHQQQSDSELQHYQQHQSIQGQHHYQQQQQQQGHHYQQQQQGHHYQQQGHHQQQQGHYQQQQGQHHQQQQQGQHHYQQQPYQQQQPQGQQDLNQEPNMQTNSLVMRPTLQNQSRISHVNDEHVSAETHSMMDGDLPTSNVSNASLRQITSQHKYQRSTSQHENPPDFSPDHNQTPHFHNQTPQNQPTGDKENAETLDNSRDDHDIIETKIILAETDLKFSGALANIAKKRGIKSEYNTSSSSSSGSASPLNVPFAMTCNNTGESLRNSLSSSPSSQLGSITQPTMSLREQVTINEKLLKKEVLPMSFPSTGEGESILVQSSIDHFVSGNESLEVDIAGRPLDSDNMFPEYNEGTETSHEKRAEKHGLAGDEVKKCKPELWKCQDQIINKSSGKLILKVRKGHSQRRPNDSSTSIVPKVDSKPDEIEKVEEQFVRRSERKRKTCQSQTKDEDAMDELDELLSDDDEEYHVESDESYDERAYGRGHSNKKKPKAPEDPTAFKINQKGVYVCWVCYKKFARCLGIKRHIIKKHSKAICGIVQEEADDAETQSPLQLLLFCPKMCKYATFNLDAYSQHLATCQKSETAHGGHDLMETQSLFMTQEYVTLQDNIDSGATVDMLKQMFLPHSGRRKRQSSSNNNSNSMSSSEGHKETDPASKGNPPPDMSDILSHHLDHHN